MPSDPAHVRSPTDFEIAGLATERAQLRGRYWLLTVDLEAFSAERIKPWCAVMHYMAKRSSDLDLRWEIFLSLEDVVRLRETSAPAYDDFLGAMKAMGAAGAAFYPHNHRLFDPDTGARPSETKGRPQKIVPGYAKRPSMFYDVVYRNGVDLGEWMLILTEVYLRILAEADLAEPPCRTFRPGGWDHGSTPDDLLAYVEALQAAGYMIDSSATRGVFGTPTWRLLTPVGANSYFLPGGILELAPTSECDWAASALSKHRARALFEIARQPRLWTRRHPGAMVTVLHLHHVFDLLERGQRKSLALFDSAVTRRRMDRVCTHLKHLEDALGISPSGFEQVHAGSDG